MPTHVSHLPRERPAHRRPPAGPGARRSAAGRRAQAIRKISAAFFMNTHLKQLHFSRARLRCTLVIPYARRCMHDANASRTEVTLHAWTKTKLVLPCGGQPQGGRTLTRAHMGAVRRPRRCRQGSEPCKRAPQRKAAGKAGQVLACQKSVCMAGNTPAGGSCPRAPPGCSRRSGSSVRTSSVGRLLCTRAAVLYAEMLMMCVSCSTCCMRSTVCSTASRRCSTAS